MISLLRPARALAQRASVWIILFALLAAPAARAEVSATSDGELVRYADGLFSGIFPAGEPGAVVLVVRDGRTVLRKAYGLAHLELGVPMQPDMVFELASITKQFTAAAILLLQDRGKLSVQDEVTRHLPDYPTHGQKITIHHLLTHTSGIPSYTENRAWGAQVRSDTTPQQLLGFFKDEPLEFSPGTKWSYSNSGYALLGAIIEKVSGKSYEEFIEQEIFAPLGMRRSRYGHRDEVVPGRVTGYQRGRDGAAYRIGAYSSVTQIYAAGALLSTVDDLALWADAIAGGKLLSRESLESRITPATLASGQSAKYGYGQGVSEEDGVRMLEHGGDSPGFACHFLHVPDRRLLVVVLSNNPTLGPGADLLAYRIVRKALGRPLEERKGQDLSPEALDEYVGVYRFDSGSVRIITRQGDSLYARREGGTDSRILALTRDELFYPDSDIRLRVRRNGRGEVAGLDFVQRYGADELGEKTGEPVPAG